jgi:hypothetical protein
VVYQSVRHQQLVWALGKAVRELSERELEAVVELARQQLQRKKK